MQSLSATEFARSFGKRNQDVQSDTIEVTSHGRPIGYYLSPREYQRKLAHGDLGAITNYEDYVAERKALEALIARLPYVSVRDTVKARAARIRSLAEECGASRVRLFGSVARGEDGPDSDIDFLIDFEPGHMVNAKSLGVLIDGLEKLLDRKVDVVDASRMDPQIGAEILKEAVDL